MEQGRVAASGGVTGVYDRYRAVAGSAKESVKVQTPWIAWGGLANRAELRELQCSDDVTCRLAFRVGSRRLEGVEIDCALVNEEGAMVTHARSRFLGRTFSLEAERTFEAAFTFQRPHLAPGGYTLTVYVRTADTVLLWIEGIEACRVIALSRDFPDGTLLDTVRSAIIAPFTLTLA
jgi:hypothetical protein